MPADDLAFSHYGIPDSAPGPIREFLKGCAALSFWHGHFVDEARSRSGLEAAFERVVKPLIPPERLAEIDAAFSRFYALTTPGTSNEVRRETFEELARALGATRFREGGGSGSNADGAGAGTASRRSVPGPASLGPVAGAERADRQEGGAGESRAATGPLPGEVSLADAAARYVDVPMSALSKAARLPSHNPNHLQVRRCGRRVYVRIDTLNLWYRNYDARRDARQRTKLDVGKALKGFRGAESPNADFPSLAQKTRC